MIILQNALNKQYKYLLRWMWKCDKNFFKDFFPSILKHKTSIMNKLTLEKGKRSKKVCERNSHFLAKESFAPFWDKVEKRCFSLVWKITNDDYICIDEVDIAKPTAKLMEWIQKIRDGSSWKIVNWYMFHWVSIKWIPVIMEQEDLYNKFKWEYFVKIVNKIIKYTKRKWTFLLDAGYDIASYFEFLNKKNIKYIIRAKKNRWYFDINTKKKMKLKEFKDWIFEVQIPNVEKNMFLHIKTNKGYDEPIRIISNNKNIDTGEYKKRWEIESIFKTMKQEFKMEKIQASNLQVLTNMVSIIMLSVALSKSLYDINSNFKWTTFFQSGNLFSNRFKKYTHKLWLTMNKNSIIWFISHTINGMYKNWWSIKKKVINKNPIEKAQLRLFTISDFLKTGEI